MSKKYIIYSDLHIGGPHEVKTKLSFGKRVIFLGDNFDIKNVKKSKLKKLIKFRNKIISKVKKSNGIYLSGNHSLMPIKEYCAFKDGIIFSHGDIFDCGIKKAGKWRRENKAGKSHIYWHLLKFLKKIIGHIFTKFGYHEAEKIARAVKNHKYKIVVIGHYHPKKLKEFNIAGTRVICVPQGKTVLNI